MKRIWNWWTRLIGVYCPHGIHYKWHCSNCWAGIPGSSDNGGEQR